MANITVTTSDDYTIIIDWADDSLDWFKVQAPVSGAWSDVAGSQETGSPTPRDSWHWVNGTAEIERAGTVVLENGAFTSTPAFEFTATANFTPSIARINPDGALEVDSRPINLPILSSTDVAALTPTEGQMVLEKNGAGTSVRLAVYLNSGWRYSAYAT